MYNSNVPEGAARELPSTKQLLKSTIIAAVVALLLLVTVVMPAEYGIDPTGVGGVIGLTRMGEIKASLAQEAAADKAADAQADAITSAPGDAALPPMTLPDKPQNHETTITLAPDEGTEVKVAMPKGAKVQYTWSTDGGDANYDVHADSKALGIDYHNYSKGSQQTKQGEIVAAFDGSHGWFWRNRTAAPMTITLQTNGQYTDIKRFQ